MSYLVLARKYRPLGFDSVNGQKHVIRTLQNSIRRGKIGHAYLFSGPRGVGKTSIARIFSKALNCAQGATAEPCLECTNCREITQGTSLAVREIDGASHNSVDNVRELIDSFRALPAPGSRYKIYIIDEVHMLSTAAFNALLKSLEEPPPHTVFILATTEVHKIPETVLSRCQRHELKALDSKQIEECLEGIAQGEGLEVDREVFRLISRVAQGSMRDAQSFMERITAFCDGKITAGEVSQILGIVESRTLFQLSEAIFARDGARALLLVGEVFSSNIDPGFFLRDFVRHWRELLIAKFAGEKGLSSIGVTEDDQVEILRQVSSVAPLDIQDLMQMALSGADTALRSYHPKYAFEALIVRMATREKTHDLHRLMEKMETSTGRKEEREAHPSSFSGTPSLSSPTSVKIIGEPRQRSEPEPEKIKAALSSPTPGSEDTVLDWSSFVAMVLSNGNRMLGEHLKRFVVEKFSPGILTLRGPDLSVSYVGDAQNKKKIVDLLTGFALTPNGWKIQASSAGKTELQDGSILSVEKKTQEVNRKKREDDIAQHPTIQSLQKIFPGSTIEKIRTKE